MIRKNSKKALLEPSVLSVNSVRKGCRSEMVFISDSEEMQGNAKNQNNARPVRLV